MLRHDPEPRDAARPGRPSVHEPFLDYDPVGANPRGAHACPTDGAPMCPCDTYITYVDRLRLAEVLCRYPVRRPPLDDLERTLLRVAPCDPRAVPRDVVTMNAVVRLRDLRSGTVSDWVLVYPGDARTDLPRLPVLSRMGAAILGRRAGDLVWWSDAGQSHTARIEAVPYQPEAAGDFET